MRTNDESIRSKIMEEIRDGKGKETLLSLIHDNVSSELYSKIATEHKISGSEQENLFKALSQSLHIREQKRHVKGSMFDKWFDDTFRKGRDYAEAQGLLSTPLQRISREEDIKDAAMKKAMKAVPMSTRTFGYHATEGRFLKQIMREGLLPRDPHLYTGLRGNKAVFFFSEPEEAVELAQGLLSDGAWGSAVILKVDVRGLPLYERATGSATGAGREFYTNRKIEPHRIVSSMKVERS